MKLKLYPPVKPVPLMINQAFGLDKATYSQFGLNGHSGLDLFTFHGQPIYASHDGMAYYETDINQGEGVVIITNEEYEYKDTVAQFKSIYWHMTDSDKEPKFTSPILKKVGANTGKGVAVKMGDLIGYADNTGFSSGDHLHYGLKPMKKVKKNLVNLEQENGFKGAIDPTPYLDSTLYPNKPKYDGTIVSVQRVLQYEGLFPANVDFVENYGPITKKGIRDFQIRYKIFPSVGFFGPFTKAKMKELYP